MQQYTLCSNFCVCLVINRSSWLLLGVEIECARLIMWRLKLLDQVCPTINPQSMAPSGICMEVNSRKKKLNESTVHVLLVHLGCAWTGTCLSSYLLLVNVPGRMEISRCVEEDVSYPSRKETQIDTDKRPKIIATPPSLLLDRAR